jgi:hypothetical protein
MSEPFQPWFPGDTGPHPEPGDVSRETKRSEPGPCHGPECDHVSHETINSFNFGDSPIELLFDEGNMWVTFGQDAWEVPPADLTELANGLKRLGYGNE